MPENSKKSYRKILKPQIITNLTLEWKELGFRGFVRKKGWKIVVAVFLFYLVRDSLLYIVIPYMAARGLWGC